MTVSEALALAIVEVHALRDGAATQWAVLQSVAADLTTTDVTTGKEYDLRLERGKHMVSYLEKGVRLYIIAY